MLCLTGKSVYEGIAIAKLYVPKTNAVEAKEKSEISPAEERERFLSAKNVAMQELSLLYEKATKELGEADAEIFKMHSLMLDDEDFSDGVYAKIDDGSTAEYAVATTGKEFSEMFAAMDDGYMRARALDVKDISIRLTNRLTGIGEDGEPEESYILACEELTPSELIKLDKSKLVGFVTGKGSSNSHTSILARTMSIPSVVDAKFDFPSALNGKTAIVDGFTGKIVIEPEELLLAKYAEEKAREQAEKERRELLKGKETVTLDGRKINLFANIGSSAECDFALSNDAEGIGLFRSEFLYLESKDYPTEERQFAEYRAVLQKMEGKTVIIRTMDVGADKKVDYFRLPEEENPALGYRSIRICADRPEILKTQLRALYRASVYGKLSIMIPMIISVEEVRWVKSLAKEVMAELTKEGKPFDYHTPIGIMIETPAAAVIANELAKEADFFSIGTNDLTQYALAMDRQNPNLENKYDKRHPAILRLIKHTVKCAHRQGKWVGICGELARDIELLPFFIKIGVDELSMSAPYILKTKEAVMNLSCNEYRYKRK